MCNFTFNSQSFVSFVSGKMVPLKLITFDLINTLVKVTVSPAHHYAMVARSVGVNIKEEDIQRVYQPTWRQKVVVSWPLDWCLYTPCPIKMVLWNFCNSFVN